MLRRVIRATALFIACLFTTIAGSAQTVPGLEADLNKMLDGQTVTLKLHYQSPLLKVDQAGHVEGSPEVGPWTLTSKLKVRRIKFQDDKITISGDRLYVEIVNGQQQLHSTDRNMSIEIQVEPPMETNAMPALTKVLLGPNESLGDFAPDYWVSYFKTPPKPKPASDMSTAANSAGTSASPPPKKVRVNSGVAAGNLIFQQKPEYPEMARANHLSGQVVFGATIGKDGNIKDLHIVKAAGMGFDEAAYAAVSKWRYRPYTINGDPVEIESQITVNFNMR